MIVLVEFVREHHAVLLRPAMVVAVFVVAYAIGKGVGAVWGET